MAKKDLIVPFDTNGNQMGYCYIDIASIKEEELELLMRTGELVIERENSWYNVTFRLNYEFVDVLQYKCYTRGRSSAKIVFTRLSNNTQVEMFLTDFDKMMQDGGMNGNTVSGVWTFTKRGSNYGVKLLKRAGRHRHDYIRKDYEYEQGTTR